MVPAEVASYSLSVLSGSGQLERWEQFSTSGLQPGMLPWAHMAPPRSTSGMPRVSHSTGTHQAGKGLCSCEPARFQGPTF